MVKLIECPRDAWQGLPAIIPPETKAAYLRRLIDAGFTHIDAVSFVSPAAVPQMADSEQVLELLGRPPQVEIIGIVVNRKGAERAIRTGAVSTLGFPYSVSPEFLRRNQHQTPEESLNELEALVNSAHAAGLGLVAYVSMAFGNPYNDPWNTRAAVAACRQLANLGVLAISLADTVGLAPPKRIAETVAAVIASHPIMEIGVHLHARRADAPSRIRAAFESGSRRFDAAIGGLGGCPFAQDALVGNIPTEVLLATLQECGAEISPLGSLDGLIKASAEIAAAAAPQA
ncbi:MAG: hydroxymethylglutaryl-CoA lyase [Terracidiphilus sp.]